MTPQERQMIDDLFGRLAGLENAPRDPDAVAAMAQGLRQAPNAVYALVQTVLVQDEALKRANSRSRNWRPAVRRPNSHPAGSSIRCATPSSGRNNAWRDVTGSVPNVPPPATSRPVWNSGQVMQQAQSPGRYDQAPAYGQPCLRSAALWSIVRRGPAADGRRWLVPGHRRGRGRRHDRRIAPARQHPLDDGGQPPELR